MTRRPADVPHSRIVVLNSGADETNNLAEWLAIDMPVLLVSVLREIGEHDFADEIEEHADDCRSLGVIGRLQWTGIRLRMHSRAARIVEAFAVHRSDVARQFATYASVEAQNDALMRLQTALRFAADKNMSVRECAWMAARPALHTDLHSSLDFLRGVSLAEDPNLRRFSIEVSRPRSVWGRHIADLKATPEKAISLLNNVKADPARYVQLSVGNWLNDAGKSRPEWVQAIAQQWLTADDNRYTRAIVRRGVRNLSLPVLDL